MEADLELVRTLVAADHGLATVATLPASGTAHLSVVNAGVLDHPVTGTPVVAFVARGVTAKLRHLRARPWASLLFRAGGSGQQSRGELRWRGSTTHFLVSTPRESAYSSGTCSSPPVGITTTLTSTTGDGRRAADGGTRETGASDDEPPSVEHS